jgi:purine-binding chemotaxis protein CheW
MSAAARAANAGQAPTGATEILRARARQLARPTVDASLVDIIGAIAFSLGREKYAIDARHVFAVFRLESLTPLPGARAPVVGVTPWRGDVLTVLDIRGLVGASPSSLDDLARVIVLGTGRPELGLLADRLDDPLRLDASDIHPLSADRASRGSDILSGITSDAVVILDASALLARQCPADELSHVAPL